MDGTGKIILKVPRTTYAPGEMIEGTLLLTIIRPVSARGLYVTLSAEQPFHEGEVQQGQKDQRAVIRKIYHFQQILDSGKEYQKTGVEVAYPFSIQVPQDAAFLRQEDGGGERAPIRAGNVMAGPGSTTAGPAEWSLEGFLDMPLMSEVKSRIIIRIR